MNQEHGSLLHFEGVTGSDGDETTWFKSSAKVIGFIFFIIYLLDLSIKRKTLHEDWRKLQIYHFETLLYEIVLKYKFSIVGIVFIYV